MRAYGTILLFFTAFFLFISCNDNKPNDTAKNPLTGAQLTDSSQLVQSRWIYTVELSKDELKRIFRSIPLNPNGKTKGKLIFQFSSSNSTNANDFDLSIFITPKHKNYAEGKTPFPAKAVARYLEIKPNERYILGNNEKSLKELKKILKNLTWTKIVFYPYIDAARQLRYMIVPHNETTALKDMKGLTADSYFFTNPSPPAKPYHEEEPDDPNDPEEPDTVILN